MTIGEICTRKVIIASRDTSVGEVAKLMREYHTGDIVVTEERDGRQRPIGIVTDRDIVLGILAQELNAQRFSASDFVSAPLVTAKEADGVSETIQLMRARGVRRVPIVDATGTLVGIVALDDILEFMAQQMGDLVSLLRQERWNEIKDRPAVSDLPYEAG